MADLAATIETMEHRWMRAWVRRDDWDTGKQQWVLRYAFDYAHCHKCDGETSISEVALAPAS